MKLKFKIGQMRIKAKPEDFYVKEIIDLSKKEPGETFKYFLMWKKNLSTIRAIKIVAKKLRISRWRISFAGEKDKRAVTEQYISIRNLRGFKEHYDFGNVKLKYIGSFAEPIRISDIVGNYFRIILRDVSKEEIERFYTNVPLYSKAFVNYFDDQRFGDIRANNHIVGKYILQRKFEDAVRVLLTYTSENENKKATEAREWLKNHWGDWREAIKRFPKWLDVELAVLNHLVQNPQDFLGALKKLHRRLLKLFLHAYQSFLWNIAVSDYIKEKCGCIRKIKISVGEFCTFSEKDCIKILDTKFPIIGYTTELENLNQDIQKIITRILEEEGISIDDFFFVDLPFLSVEGSERNILAKPKEFKFEIEKDLITLEFILGRGEYATMLIKHLFL